MNGVRVLIVDDDAGLRTALRMLANSFGAEVVGEADNGRTAIEEAERLNPEVMLLDVSMPVMGGIAAARHLHETRPNVRIILVSQHKLKVYAEEALNLGARGYVLKASAATELGPAIEAVMAGEKFISAAVA